MTDHKNEGSSQGRIERPGRMKLEAQGSHDTGPGSTPGNASDTLTDFEENNPVRTELAAPSDKPAGEPEVRHDLDKSASEILRGRDAEVLRYLRAGTVRRQTEQLDKENIATSAVAAQLAAQVDGSPGRREAQ